jgi:metal-responsive CopG/Arc/MetJ family transcriptional regulator
MSVRTNLLLPKDLVEELDRVAGPRNRSRFVAEAIRYRLKRERLRVAWEESFGILSAEDHPHWATSEMVVEWVRAMRAEETDPGPDPVEPVGIDDAAPR